MNLLDRNVPLHIVKFFIFWYREQEFMVDGVTHYQWYSVVQMGSGKVYSYHDCYIIYTVYRRPKPLPPSNRCRVLDVEGAWVNSLS